MSYLLILDRCVSSLGPHFLFRFRPRNPLLPAFALFFAIGQGLETARRNGGADICHTSRAVFKQGGGTIHHVHQPSRYR